VKLTIPGDTGRKERARPRKGRARPGKRLAGVGRRAQLGRALSLGSRRQRMP
jgi:hypothetical protein